MRYVSRFIIAAAATGTLVACTARPTRVTTTFRDPGTASARFRKTIAFFPGDDATLRRRVENRVANRLPNVTAPHTLVSDEQLAAADTQAIRSTVIADGFAGALVLRLISVEGQLATGASPSEDLWAYSRRAPRRAFRPGQETVITMESSVYAVPGGKLLWAGRSESFNPVSLGELVDMIVDASIEEVRRQGLFATVAAVR